MGRTKRAKVGLGRQDRNDKLFKLATMCKKNVDNKEQTSLWEWTTEVIGGYDC